MNKPTKQYYYGVMSVLGVVLLVGYASALITNNGNGTWTFSYTANNTEAVRIANAFASVYHYQAAYYNDDDVLVNNPQSKAQFTDYQIKRYIQDVVTAYELEQAKKAVATPKPPEVS